MALVAHYKLDGNANDSSGNGFDGTPTDMSYQSGGVSGEAGIFNGTTSGFQANAAAVALNTGAATVAMWFRLDNAINSGTAANQTMISFDWTGAAFQRRFYLDFPQSVGGNEGKLRCLFEEADLGTRQLYTSQSSWAASTWYHVAVSIGDNPASIYIDGALAGTLATADGAAGMNLLFVGGRIGVGYFDGLIDDVRIYDHALTGAEVLSLYNSYFATGRYVPLIGGGSLMAATIPLIGDPAGGLIH